MVRRHAGAVTAYARAMTSDRWTAEDAVQETFLRAWRYQDSFRNDGSFEGWLIRICRNCVIDIVTRRPIHQSIDDLDDQPEQATDTTHEVTDLLARIPLPQREAMVICGLLGYDYDRAATLLDIPIGTLRSRLHRGRQALATLIADADVEVLRIEGPASSIGRSA